MDILAFIAERKILEAMGRGEWNDLPGTGKPLRPEDDSMVPALSRRFVAALRGRRELWRFLLPLTRAVEAAGGSAYLVGGLVRDIVEGRPGKDIDVMVTGLEFDALGRLLRALPAPELGIRRIVRTGKRFPVYKIRTAWAGDEIDVAPARRGPDGPPEGDGGRLLDRQAREDAAGRDFTINSLLFRLRTRNGGVTGSLLDFFGGLADLDRRLIRGVGNPADRFREDPLRLLRAIRLKNERAGYAVERRTWEAMRRHGPSLLPSVPPDRVAGELMRSLAADPAGTVDDLHGAGLLPLLLPEAPWEDKGLVRRMARRYELLERALGSPLPQPVLQAGLLADVAEGECAELVGLGLRAMPRARRLVPVGPSERRFFRLSRTGAAAARLRLPGLRPTVRLLEDMVRLVRFPYLRHRRAQAEAILARQGDPGHLIALYEASRKAAGGRRPVDFRRLLADAARRPPLLSAADLVGMGIPPGPRLASTLEEVREATLAGNLSTTEEARDFALSSRLRRREDARARRARPLNP